MCEDNLVIIDSLNDNIGNAHTILNEREFSLIETYFKRL